jgi:hypothetical protein
VVPQPHEANPFFGMRILNDIDPTRLRLFFGSLLWRAAASGLDDFSHIILSEAELARLGESLRTGVPLDDNFYPVTLMQYSTMGNVHFATPSAKLKPVVDNDGNPLGVTPIYRFYFDGLIAHFHRPCADKPQTPLGIAGVGNP